MAEQRRKHSQARGASRTGKQSHPATGAGGSGSSPTRGRRLVYGLITAILALLLGWRLLEVGLRLAGFGVSMDVLVPDPRPGAERLLSNPCFTWQFFGPEKARDFTSFSLERDKPDDVCRIFVLGGSAAQGDPRPVFGFDRMLETMLRERYPGKDFEVINASITAVNSHVMLRVARACADLDPDLFLIYMGNNEVVGPYGAGSVFSPVPRHRWAIAPDLAWRRSRLGQFVAGMQRGLAAKGRDRTWRGMELFLDYQVAADDPKLEFVYRHFEDNLRDIIDLAHRAGAGVVLSTVAVNLKDCAPFSSRHREGLPPAELQSWETAFTRGISFEADAAYAEALAAYRDAEALDDAYAELAFRMARCHLALGDTASARGQYCRARDLDTLRFRADTRDNEILRSVAADLDPVRLVDAEQVLGEHGGDGLPGADLFFEHVHLRFDGNYLVARAMMDEIHACLPDLAQGDGAPPEPLSRDAVAERLAFTDWDGEQVTGEVLGRLAIPPFTAQIDNRAQRETLRREQAAFAERLAAGGLAVAAEAIAGATVSEQAHSLQRMRHAAFVLSRGGRVDEAVRQLDLVIKEVPQSSTAWIMRGQALGAAGRHDDALESLRRALALNPYSAGLLTNLGVGQQRAGRNLEAKRTLEQALEMDPFEELAHFNLGVLLLSGNKTPPAAVGEAVEHYRAAVEINPAYHEARHNLSRLYYRQAQAAAQAGVMERGVELLDLTVATDPSYAFPHYNLGVIYFSNLHDREKAAKHFRAFLDAAGTTYPNERAAAERALEEMGAAREVGDAERPTTNAEP